MLSRLLNTLRSRASDIETTDTQPQKRSSHPFNKTSSSNSKDLSARGPYTDKQCLLDLANAGSKINLSKATYALSRSSGTHHSNQRGRGMEFLESRHYQAGDDIRSIDWRVTARTGKTHTKVFAEEREQPVFVLCDQSPYMFFGSQIRFKSVQATNLASLIAWSALKQGDRFGGEIIGPNEQYALFKLSRNRSRMLQFLEQASEINHQLNNHDASDYSLLAKRLDQLRFVISPGTRLYIISDLFAYNDQALKALAQLSAHAQITLFAINDPIEVKPPCAGQSRISTGNQLLSLNLNKEQQQKIYDHYLERSKQITQYLYNWNIPLIPVSTMQNPVDLFNTHIHNDNPFSEQSLNDHLSSINTHQVGG